MSNTIDERVVEMRFDNSNFESNVKTSMSTLEKLKSALNMKGAEKSFDDIDRAAKNVSFNGLEKGVDALHVKFSALQVMGVTALKNITDSAVNAGKSILKSLTSAQIDEGWAKYNDKTASMQTLVNATGKSIDEINGYIEKIAWFSDETSYSLTEMVSALSQMASSGADIGQVDKLIMGLANSVSFAGKGAREFSIAMNNVTQAYSLGYMGINDWRSLKLQNVTSEALKQTFIDTAIALGKLDENGKTAKGTLVDLASFDNTLSEKWADVEVMEKSFAYFAEMSEKAFEMVQNHEVETASEAYKKLAETFDTVSLRAAMSAQEAKSFEEAIDSVKKAVSTGWMNTFEIIFGNYEQAKELWTDLANGLYDVFTESGYARNELLDGLFNARQDIIDYTELMDAVGESGIASKDFQDAVIAAAREHGVAIDEMIDDEHNFADSLKEGWLTSEILTDGINKMGEAMNGTTKIVKDDAKQVAHSLDDIKKVAREVLNGQWGSGSERVDLLTKAGYDPKMIQRVADELHVYGGVMEWTANEINAAYDAAKDLADVQEEQMSLTVEGTELAKTFLAALKEDDSALSSLLAEKSRKKTGRELALESVYRIARSLRTALDAVKAAFRDVFPPVTSEQLYNLLDKFNEFTKKIEITSERGEKLRRIFKGVFSVFGSIKDILGKLISGGFNIIKSLIGDIDFDFLGFIANIGDALSQFKEWLGQSDIFEKGMEHLTHGISMGREALGQFIYDLNNLPEGQTLIDVIKNFISNFMDLKAIDFQSMSDMFNNFFTGIKKSYDTSIKTIRFNLIEFVFGGITKSITNGLNSVKSGIDAFKESLMGVGQSISEALDPVKRGFDLVMQYVSKVADWINERFGGIDVGQLLATGLGVVSIEIFHNLAGLIKSIDTFIAGFAKLGDSISNVINNFGGIFKSVSGVIDAVRDGIKAATESFASLAKATKFKMIVDAILELAIAVGILAAAAFVLSKYADPSKLWSCAGVIAVLLLVMGLLALMISKASQLMTAKSVAGAWAIVAYMLSIALVLAVLTKSINDIKDIPWKRLAKCVGALAGLMLALSISMGIMSRIAPKLATHSIALIPMAAAIWILCKSVHELSNIANEGDLDGAIKSLRKIMRSLAAMAAFMSAIKLNPLAGLGLLGIVLAIGLMTIVIKKLVEMSETLTINDPIKLIGICVGILVAFVVLMVASKAAGKYAASAGIGLIGIALALHILIGLVDDINQYSRSQLFKAGWMILALSAFVAGLVAVTHFAGQNALKASVGMIFIAAAIGILAIIVALLGNLELSVLIKGVVAVGFLSAFVAGLLYATKYANGSLKTIIPLAVAIGVLAAAVAVLSVIRPERLIPATIALGVIMGMFSLMMFTSKFVTKEFKSLALMLVAVGLIAAILYVLSEFTDVDKLLTVSESLSLILLAISAAMFISSKVPLSGAVTGALAIVAFVGILGAIAAGVGYLLDYLDSLGIDYLAKMDKCKEFVQKVGEILGVLVGGFIGATIGAAAESMADFLPAVGEDLSLFAEKIQGFLTTMDGVDDSLPGKVSTLVTAIGKLLGNSVWNSITTWFNGGSSTITQLAEDLKKFSSGFEKFLTLGQMTGLDESIANVEKVSAMVDKLPSGNGWLNKKTSLNTLGNDLARFAEGLSQFCKVDVSNASNAVEATGEIIEMASDAGDIQSTFGVFVDSLNTMVTTLETYEATFRDAGETLITKLASGMSSKTYSASNAAKAVMNSAIGAISGYYLKFYDTGRSAAQGIIDGILSKLTDFYNAGKKAGEAFRNGYNAGSGGNSSASAASSAGAQVAGDFARGIQDHTGTVFDAGRGVMETAVDGMRTAMSKAVDLLSDVADYEPTITPVLDLTEIQNGADKLNSIMGSKTLNLGTVAAHVSGISTSMNKSSSNSDDMIPVNNNSVVNNYTQNNYSPKALSRIEIYRQTRNLLASTKG